VPDQPPARPPGAAAPSRGPTTGTAAGVALPLGLFGIPFGITGLATAWAYAAARGLAPPGIRDGLSALGGVVWIVLLIAYTRRAGARPWRTLAADLADPTAGPFGALVLISPMVLTVDGLLPYAPGVAHVIVVSLIAAIVALGSWFIGHWMYQPMSFDQLHPGYFLPTVAGGLLASAAATACGYTRLGHLLFGSGVIFWLILGSMILSRLLFMRTLPVALTPTIAIEVAPAPVATIAYLSFTHDRIDSFATALGGYALVMVLAQIPMLPAYRDLRFAPSFWSFTFSWAVVATAGLHWLADEHPPGWRIYAYVALGAISLLIAAIAIRTVLALMRGTFLPPPRPVDPATTARAARSTPERTLA
jgi:tellurite resistance protein